MFSDPNEKGNEDISNPMGFIRSFDLSSHPNQVQMKRKKYRMRMMMDEVVIDHLRMTKMKEEKEEEDTFRE
uniref:Uncharacterized protein n=1 Tax=Pristionchus pacificus TaxID=54126 RepID=A0A2A6CRP9_PRIPA|eukprot:PDM80737.1 hypothetical protein PRIPAC_35740 [Pristionchus pacificus]